MDGRIFGAIMQLVSSFSKDPTTLRQEMPVLPPIPPEQVVDYLIPHYIYHEDLWSDAKKYWESKADKKKDPSEGLVAVINPKSTLGYLVNLTKEPLNSFERNLEKQMNETYEENIDEVDRSTIDQFSKLGQYFWEQAGPWIKVRLIDGALFSYIDQQQYLKAAEFSYLNMSYHKQAIGYARDLLFLAQKKYSDRCKDQPIIKREEEERDKFWLWHERFRTTAQVNHVLHHLTNLFFLYHEQFYKAHKKGLLSQAYRFMSVKNEINSAICELKAAHHNHLAQTRLKNWFGATLEMGMTYVSEWFLHRGYFRVPRSFNEILKSCELLAHQEYENLRIYQIPSRMKIDSEEQILVKEEAKTSTEDVLTKYIEAIEADNFAEAKRCCTWYPTKMSEVEEKVGKKEPEKKESESSDSINLFFDWSNEYQDMENYYRSVQMIFYFQDQLTEMVTQLYQRADHAFSARKKSFYDDVVHLQAQLIDEIHQLHAQRRELKKSYINFIRTKFDMANKGLWERVSHSLSRKAFRYFKDGTIYHSITPYEEQEKVLWDKMAEVAQRMETVKRIALSEDSKDEFFKDLVTNLQYIRHTFPPFVIMQDQFVKVYQSIRNFDGRDIRDLSYNIERNKEWFPDQQIWFDLSPVFTNYLDLRHKLLRIIKFSDIISRDFVGVEQMMRKQLAQDQDGSPRILLTLDTFGQAISSVGAEILHQMEDLNHVFNQNIIMIVNSHTPVDTTRFLSSLSRKVTRFTTTGQILGDKRTILGEIGTILKNLEGWKKTLIEYGKKVEKMKAVTSQTSDDEAENETPKKVVIMDNYIA